MWKNYLYIQVQVLEVLLDTGYFKNLLGTRYFKELSSIGYFKYRPALCFVRLEISS